MCKFNSFYLQISFKISFIQHILVFMVQDQHGFQSQIRQWENCWLASITPELMFVFLISLTSQFQSNRPLNWNPCSVQKVFRSNKLSSHLHTINACGACIITVARRSAHNSMLHKRLKGNNKTQSKFMTYRISSKNIILHVCLITFSYKPIGRMLQCL